MDGYADDKECRVAGKAKLKRMADFVKKNNSYVSVDPGSRFGIFDGLSKGDPGHIQSIFAPAVKTLPIEIDWNPVYKQGTPTVAMLYLIYQPSRSAGILLNDLNDHRNEGSTGLNSGGTSRIGLGLPLTAGRLRRPHLAAFLERACSC